MAAHGAKRANQTPAPVETGRRSTRRRELVMSELLDRATELFAERGYESTSLQDIAESMGVSRPALYHYVSSKEDLLTALVEDLSEGVAEQMGAISGRADLAAADRLKELTTLLVRDRASRPAQFRILDRSEAMLPPPVRTAHLAARRKVLARLVAVIDDGIAGGEFKSVDSRVAALSILGMCNWVAWWFRPGPGHEVEPVVAQISQSALDLLGASRARRARPDSAAAAVQRLRAEIDTLESLLPRRPPRSP